MKKDFFINSSILYKLNILDNVYNILPKKNKMLSYKKYNYYVSLIKKYRLFGIFTSKKIKLNIVNKKH